MPTSKRVSEFDEMFPVLVRYTGWLSTVILIGFCLAGYAERAAPGFVAAAGMILYKKVRDAANKIENEASDGD